MGQENKILVIYGSQTGQAEAISAEICDMLANENLEYVYKCMDELNKVDVQEALNYKLVIAVLSSTGDGDPPDNASKFMRRLNNNELSRTTLSKLKFALLGLGDSNYSTFHGVPKKFEKRLLELGAKPLVKTGLADDATGLEIEVEPWMESLIPAVQEFVNAPDEEESAESCDNVSKDLEEKLNISDPDSASHQENGAATDGKDESELEKILSDSPLEWPDKPCLIQGCPELRADEQLRVPIVSGKYLHLEMSESVMFAELALKEEGVEWQNGSPFPGTLGSVTPVTIKSLQQITHSDASKAKYEFEIDIEGTDLKYEPGDAFYFIFPNPSAEVEYLLKRLCLWDKRDKECNVSLLADAGANKKFPVYVSPKTTLLNLFTYTLDFRRTPGRPILRVLAEYAKQADEKRRLMELSSSQGVKEMTEFVRSAGLSLLDLLSAFPSTQPPLEYFIQLLPRLQPRPYSVSTSPLTHGSFVRFAFSQVIIPKGDGRFYRRFGLCTKYITDRSPGDTVLAIFQEPKWFRLPEEQCPLVMIGPGTGVTPFLSFLHHLRHQDQENETKSDHECRWLFYGCRHKDQDWIYKDEIESFLADKTLSKFNLAQSQNPESESGKYVQNELEANGKEIVDLLEVKPNTRVYICGDAEGMSKDVFATFTRLFVQHLNLSEKEAMGKIMELKKKHNYVEDVWA